MIQSTPSRIQYSHKIDVTKLFVLIKAEFESQPACWSQESFGVFSNEVSAQCLGMMKERKMDMEDKTHLSGKRASL